MTDFLLTIKILTRDNPAKLKSCLEHLKNDITNLNSDITLALIDDSTNLKNRHKNRELFLRIFSKKDCPMHYLSNEEYSQALIESPLEVSKKILSLVGMMGSSNYKPSRAKNISQFIEVHSDFHLLLDDDVIIENSTKLNNSVVENALISAEQKNSFVSINLKGFLDLSLIQLLERSIIKDKKKLNEWNADISPFGLSGGFLLYSHDNNSLIFPDLYDEDYLWVAFSSTKKNMGSLQLHSNVFHKPTRKKIFSLDRLTFQGMGEITYLSLTEKSSQIDDFVFNKKYPNQDVIQDVIGEYCEYLKYIIALLKISSFNEILNSPFLEKIPTKDCDLILKTHLKNVRKLPYRTIQKNYQNWMNQQNEWIECEPNFSSSILEVTKL